MPQTCTKCQRINPGEAVYCYWDGALLHGHSVNGGPLNPGVMPFPSPFVFPSGQSCQNFDQLAMACQNYWKDAIDLLRKGFFGGFFGSLGRADLAMAAQEAAQFPDQDRGLDQLLAKFPSRALEAPKLKVEPLEVNLGTVPMGTDRQFEIHLNNLGMRLLFGSIASDSKWMTIGEAPGQNQKIFQFREETVIPVQIRGKELRAGTKALEGHLFIDSNGGQQIQITVRLEVPVKPFKDGVLAGATTPRQIAEKAKANPKEAAALFENGSVSRWFSDNGWIYPVQGPSASGIGAVQQFFEALGLAKAPKVLIDKQFLQLQGAPNQALQTTLEVKTEEKRPVYAHATANVPWLDVSQVRLAGRSAAILVRIPSVPYNPGQMLSAKIRVAANGNQRFEVLLNLNVLTGPGAPWAPTPALVPGGTPYPPEPVLAIPGEPVLASPGVAPMPAEIVPASPAHIPPGAPVMPAIAVDENDPFAAFATGSSPAGQMVGPGPVIPTTRPHTRVRRSSKSPSGIHLLPLVLLLLILMGTVARDLLWAPGPVEEGASLERFPLIGVRFDYPFGGQPGVSESMRFGVAKFMEPNNPQGAVKNLTFRRDGTTNSTVLRIDGQRGETVQFADLIHGKWEEMPNKIGKGGGARASWLHLKSKIKVTQIVELIPGDPFIDDKGRLKQAVDTCLAKYEIVNTGTEPRQVGLRFMLDTLIGGNDGVPFTVAGEHELVDTFKEFNQPDTIPDFVQALERPNLNDPGVVVRVQLKNPGLETPSRVLLTEWPGWGGNVNEKLGNWDVPLKDFKEKQDSAVAMYWEEKELKPGEKRVLGFTYGLVHLAKGAGNMSAFPSGDYAPNKKITITALITSPQKGETLSLKLPEGLKLMEGDLEQKVPPPEGALTTNPNPIYWYITATRTGDFPISITSNKGRSVELSISITAGGIFGGS